MSTYTSNNITDQYVPNNSQLEIDSSNVAKQSNIFYKGWILTYQDLSNDIAGNLSNNSLVDNLKWVPKFAVISRVDKCVLLYDYEPSNEILSNNFHSIMSKQFITSNTTQDGLSILPFPTTSTTSSSSSSDSIANSNFSSDLSTCRLDNSVNSELFVKYWKSRLQKIDFSNTDRYFKCDDSFIGKEMESLNQTTHPESSSTFRFAGLFFKKDKTDKIKHSSLKRAKSGIQLERKKTGTNITVLNDGPKSNQQTIDYENRNSLPSPMRPSRSHESLSSPLKPSTTINSIETSNNTSKRSNFPRFLPSYKSKTSHQTPKTKIIHTIIDQAQVIDALIQLNLNSKNNRINSVHNSLFNEENCFEIKCATNTITIVNPSSRLAEKSDSSELDDETDSDYTKNRQSRRDTCDKLRYHFTPQDLQTRYFMCRSSEERDKWLQCLRDVAQPNLLNQRRDENSLQVWLLEAKGTPINSKPNKKYFCEIYLNSCLHGRSCAKEKKDILFWGESFEFSNINCDTLKVEVYQQVVETQKKKSKKDSSHTLLGFVNIPVSSIESSQPVEKWYKLEPGNNENKHDNLENSTNSSASFTTTQNFSKDSISIRIKAKYQSVDILPFTCYNRLIEFIRAKYLNLITLEPYLNVRIKDDLANSLVRIAYKLKLETKFLTDLVLAEVLQLEDNSLTFRGNSLATKSMESYMKLVGENYLKITLSDCVKSIIETPNDLEIDPSKVANQSSLNTNREELVQILHLVCGRVFNSFSNFPIEMKQVFSCLRSECKKNGKTDEMCDTLISASIFLRFICPAILSPNLFNLTQEYPQEKAARKLTLTAKTLQTIANFSKFGGKEFYMSYEKMNHFVDEHTYLMRDFLRKISTLSEDEEYELKNEGQVLPILTLTPQTPKTPKSMNFDLELVDLGKQLSILHSLLTSIESSLDEATKAKFDAELSEILEEISKMKKMDASEQTVGYGQNSKLYSYDNPLHFAVMKNQRQDNSPITPSTPSESTPSSINSNSEHHNTNNSSSSSSRYSSQITLNVNNNMNEVNISSSSLKGANQVNAKESEINLLKQKLKETELSLKKEQTEKYLIEFKLKQQQQENEKQMRNVINRLIKVEEELRKEQSEMHKLLKAKQEMIEIQKKRIEYLSNRSLNGSNNLSNKSTQYTNQVLNNSSQNSLNSNYNSYQPKLRQLNKTQLKPQISASLSASNDTVNSVAAHSSQSSLSKLNDKPQIAASPSSSSSSMTQFCSYLTNNGKSTSKIKIPAKTATILDQLPSNSNSLSSSTSSNLSNLLNQAQLNGQASNNFLRASEL